MSNFFNYSSFPGIRPRSGADTADMSRSGAVRRIAADVVVAAGVLALFGVVAWLLPQINEPIGPSGVPSTVSDDLHLLPYYALRSVFRMFIALFLSLVFSFIYGLAAARCRRLRMVLIPLLDILQSVPILGFLSATVTIWMVLFPGSILGVEAASIFAIFTSQAWNMTFSFYHSLLSEPQELDEAARSMQLTRWQRFWKLDVPNSMIPLLWNCMMSVGGGWFFLTASEMISVNNRTYALPGLGSFVAVASEHEQLGKVLWAIVTMVIVVLLIDVLLWKPLTAWAEKFRITQNESVQAKTSLVLWMLVRFISDGEGFAEVGHAMVLGLITFMRVTLLTVVCSIIWVPIGVKIGMNPRISRFVQPLVQVLASFPSNFTFPFVTLWFIAWHIDISWGSILLMSLGTQWYILFNVIAGASAIPDDLREATRAFHLDTRQRWTKLILPAVFGSWCTGGITAAGGAWNASIVSEIVTYGHTTLTANGLGTYIANATAVGDTGKTIIGVAVMSVFVVGVNRLFWRPLQAYAERRFSVA